MTTTQKCECEYCGGEPVANSGVYTVVHKKCFPEAGPWSVVGPYPPCRHIMASWEAATEAEAQEMAAKFNAGWNGPPFEESVK